MAQGIVDITKILILEPTNKELCDLIKERINTLKDAINVCSPGGNKSRLISDIDTLSFEINDRLLTKSGGKKDA